ncbi:hypothetical protein BGY98DRAFT_8516 [Russula aff. rugulosa BPL654]|nr:hypothetical protein BGY98DRAFT_8516 [Russula aff. rugulosa BPL654]
MPSGVFRPLTSIRDGRNTDHSQRNVNDQSTQTGQGSSQAGAHIPVASNPIIDCPQNTSESEEPRMIGDFDGTASKFWKIFKNEANSHDDARINTLKEGMDNAPIFIRSYSYSACASVMDLVMLTCGSTGWFIFCFSYTIHSR